MTILFRGCHACVLATLLVASSGYAEEPAASLNKPEVILTPVPGPQPRINGPKIYGARPSHPFLYRIPVSGERPLGFASEGLPPGLSLDAKSGLITGTATRAGTYPVALKAANAAGADKITFKIVIGDTLALTPPMGFNTWNYFNGGINDKIIRATADVMIKSGLADHGWSYVNLDDCWMRRPVGAHRNPGDIQPVRDAWGGMMPNLWRFPDITGLAVYIHELGLKFGIYSSPGFRTCAWSTGTLGHEDEDARQFGKWGVDYIKYDWCSAGFTANYLRSQEMLAYLDFEDARELDQASRELHALHQAQNEETADQARPQIRTLEGKIRGLEAKVPDAVRTALVLKYQKEPYARFGRSLAQVDRDIVYSFCQYGDGKSWEWAASLGAHSWRTTGDIQNKWESVKKLGFVQQNGLEIHAGPGHWNDPDMLEVGNGKLTPDENYTHMTQWCMLAAPLLIGCDLTKMSAFTKSLFTNDEVLAIDQDELGRQGHLGVTQGDSQVWIKPLADGSLAVALYNLGETPTTVEADWAKIGREGPQTARDLWRQKDLGVFSEKYSAEIAPHGAVLIRVANTGSAVGPTAAPFASKSAPNNP